MKLVAKTYGPRHAVLDEDGNPVMAELIEWAVWFERNRQRYIARDPIEDHAVSTVFIGLDHQLSPEGPPLWFETMVFGPPYDADWGGRIIQLRPELWCERTPNKAHALAAHQEGIEWLKKYLAKKT